MEDTEKGCLIPHFAGKNGARFISRPKWTTGPLAATEPSEGCERGGARAEGPPKFSIICEFSAGLNLK
jgi:hypothetical protein